MNTISRQDLQRFLTVARKACRVSPRGTGPPVTLTREEEGGRIHARNGEAAVELRVEADGPEQTVTIPFSCLVEISGKTGGSVEFEATRKKVRVRCQNGAAQGVKEFERLKFEPFPTSPVEYRENHGLLRALDAASQASAQVDSRYTLQCVQLQGKNGRIVATDGHQLFVHGGCQFPWSDDLLIPASKVFGNRALPADGPVSIGKTDSHVFLVTGPWTLAFPICNSGRFPNVESFIPTSRRAGSRMQIAETDADFLLDRLPKLPGKEDHHSPVTVDLNGHVALRAAEEDGKNPVEVVLSQSSYKGKVVGFSSNRQFINRALKLGFREFCLPKDGSRAWCLDGDRSFVWALLDSDSVIRPKKQMQRIASPSPTATPTTTPSNNHKPKRERNRMPRPASQTSQNGNGSQDAGIDGIIEQAEELKTSLRESLTKVNEFVGALKRQKKQAKLVRTTLASLKQLQRLDA